MMGFFMAEGIRSRKANSLDNACVALFFSNLKAGVFLVKAVQSEEETSTLTEEYIHFYNTERFPKRISQLSPIKYREKWPLNLRH